MTLRLREETEGDKLAGQLAQKFLLVHAVLEGFSSVDEHDRDLIVKLVSQFAIAIDVDFLPRKSAAAGKLVEAFLYQFTKMASLSRVNHHLAGFRHGRIVALPLLLLARKKRRQKKRGAEDVDEGPGPTPGVKSRNARSRT